MKKLFLLFSLLISVFSFATHNMAGNLTYRYAGSTSFPYRYEIILTTYTKWVGTSGTDKCELPIQFGDGVTEYAPRVNGTSFNCPSEADGILIGGCTGNVRINQYRIFHDYPGVGTYAISMEDPNRSAGLCNISDSDNKSFNLQAELIINPLFGNNEGPYYNATPVICPHVGAITYYNPGISETEGDSLFYELVPARANGAELSMPFEYTFPASSNFFTIDSLTGTVKWDAPTMLCEYVFNLRITEYRKISGTYYKIGWTMEEIWAQVQAYSGIDDEENAISLSVFPNPSRGILNLNLQNSVQGQNYQVLISNSLGQILKTADLNEGNSQVNEGDLKPGIYFYTLLGDGQVLNKGKFVILEGLVK